jgi:hypothetical protein
VSEIKAGDEVRVFDRNGPGHGQPSGGWPGTVTKVGRTLIHVEYGNGRAEKFRKDTGCAPNAYSSPWIRTPEQVALAERGAAAGAILREHHITLGYARSLTLEQIEALAEVARTFTTTEAGVVHTSQTPCPECGCDPDQPWGCDCDNPDCPCSEEESDDNDE